MDMTRQALITKVGIRQIDLSYQLAVDLVTNLEVFRQFNFYVDYALRLGVEKLFRLMTDEYP